MPSLLPLQGEKLNAAAEALANSDSNLDLSTLKGGERTYEVSPRTENEQMDRQCSPEWPEDDKDKSDREGEGEGKSMKTSLPTSTYLH